MLNQLTDWAVSTKKRAFTRGLKFCKRSFSVVVMVVYDGFRDLQQ